MRPSSKTTLLHLWLACSTLVSFRIGLDAASRFLRRTENPFYATDFINTVIVSSFTVSAALLLRSESFTSHALAVFASLCYAFCAAAWLTSIALVCACVVAVAIFITLARDGFRVMSALSCFVLLSSLVYIDVPIIQWGGVENSLAISAFTLITISQVVFFRALSTKVSDANSNSRRTIRHVRGHSKRSSRSYKSFLVNADIWTKLSPIKTVTASLRVDMCVFIYALFCGCMLFAVVYAAGLRARYVLKPSLPREYKLREQRESVTGLISVIEDMKRNIRFLTCDHSVLGGIYVSPTSYGQSIYAQFHVHEAVRLSRAPEENVGTSIGGRNGRVLCIGIGIGVVADALHALGCEVDAVEIDPTVVLYAQTYFHFRPTNVYVEDAQLFLKRARLQVSNGTRGKYDYIIHDVFTGGAVPLGLISRTVLSNIADILTPSGILALNFVGETDGSTIAGPLAVGAVAARLREVFPHVRGYAEVAGTQSPGIAADSSNISGSVQNIVFFASSAASRMKFRVPSEHDALGCPLRAETLERFTTAPVPDAVLYSVTSVNGINSLIRAGQRLTAAAHWRTLRKEFGDELWHAIASQ